ncbi:MAG: hypothetical protein DRP42_00165 [Tenericutes bacterium]|nr:MAG: hypothetical protein DRP42_00165 [Mycoplasmatota bacterium]
MEFIKDTESESIDSIADISIEHFFNQIKELLEVTLSVTKFDRYVSERKYFEDGTTEDLLKELESKKATYEKDGAL